MNESQKNILAGGGDEEQYIKDMKFNTLIFEQKLQKLKKKAKELQQKDKERIKYKKKVLKKNIDKKYYSTAEKPKTIEVNNQYSKTSQNHTINNNSTNNYSRKESKEIKSTINNPEFSIINDANTSISNMYYTIDDDFFNDNSIRKDYKIRELIKKIKQL